MPQAQQLVLVGWLAAGLVLLGLGTLVGRLLRLPARGGDDDLRRFWLGWTGLLCGLQAWHFFLPLDGRAVLLTAALGGAGLILDGLTPWRRRLRSARRHPFLLLAGAAAAAWLSNLSLANPQFGDVGSYHIPLLRWTSEFPIVPGLGNLFFPLGYAQSYFLYLAWLNVGPFAGRPYHVANGLLLLALVARGLLGGARLMQRDGRPTMADLFYGLCLPALAEWGAGVFLTTPSPDVAVFALGLLISGELIPFVVQTPEPIAPGRLEALTLLAAAAVTVKLSIAGLALAALAVAIWAWGRRHRLRGPAAVGLRLRLATLAALALVPWLVRQILLTGCPLYPSRLAALPLDWQVPLDVVAIQRLHNHTIRAAELGFLWRDPRFFLQRLANAGWTDPHVVSVMRLAAAAAIFAGVARLTRLGKPSTGSLPLIALAPTTASFVLCFFGTSVPRFFGATLWLLPIQMLLVGTGEVLLRRRWGRAATILLLVVATGLQVRSAPRARRRFDDFVPFTRIPVASTRLPSGLTVNVPVTHHLCWDAPLPCTPEPNRALRLRRPADLRSGFVIDPSLR